MSSVISSVTNDLGAGTFGPGSVFTFTVHFNQLVEVADVAKTLTLSNGVQLIIDDGTYTTTRLTFVYTVGATGSGESTGDIYAVRLDGAFTDEFGTPFDVTLVNANPDRVQAIDTTAPDAPSITSVGGSDGIVSGQFNDGLVVGTSEAFATITLTDVGTTTADEFGNWSYMLTPDNIASLGDGLRVLGVTASDAVGNVSDGSLSAPFLIDSTAETGGDLALTLGATLTNNAQKTAVPYTVFGLDADATGEITFSSNGGGTPVVVTVTANGAATVDLSSLADGQISAMLSATDTLGNRAPPVFSSGFLTLDTQPPLPPGLLQLAPSDDTGLSSFDGITMRSSFLTITGVAESGFSSIVSLFEDVDNDGVMNGSETVIATAPASGGTFMADVSLTEGTHYIRAFQTDAAGNVGGVSHPVQITVDTTADVGSDLALSFPASVVGGPGIGNVAFSVFGQDADVVEAKVRFSNDFGGPGPTFDAASGSADLSGFFSGSVYATLTVTDRAGNTKSTFNTIMVDRSADADHNLMLSILGPPVLNSKTVVFTVSGIDGDVTAATVTFSDGAGHTAMVNSWEGVADLSAFDDGPLFAALDVTDAVGSRANYTATPRTIDTTADGGDPATLVVEPLIGASEVGTVSYTVAGVDADVSVAWVTFTDRLGNGPLTPPAYVSGDGTYSADLTGLADGPIVATLHVVDAAGNAAHILGSYVLLSQDPALTISFGQYALFALTDELNGPDFTSVTLRIGGSKLATLTPADILALGPNGVDILASSNGEIILDVAQFLSLGTVQLVGLDTVIIRDTADNLAALDLSSLAAGQVDMLDATTPLTLSWTQLSALGPVALKPASTVTLALDDGERAGINFGSLAGVGIDILAAADGSLELSLAQVQALGKVKLSSDTVTVADTQATLQALTPAALRALVTKGVDALRAADGDLVFTRAQVEASGGMALSATGTVTLADTGRQLAGLSAGQIGGLATAGVTLLDATTGTLSLSKDQHDALGAVQLDATDIVTLADTGATLKSMLAFADPTTGIDVFNATDDALSLTVSELQTLGSIGLTRGRPGHAVGRRSDDHRLASHSFRDRGPGARRPGHRPNLRDRRDDGPRDVQRPRHGDRHARHRSHRGRHRGGRDVQLRAADLHQRRSRRRRGAAPTRWP
jgi:hypothetical protein